MKERGPEEKTGEKQRRRSKGLRRKLKNAAVNVLNDTREDIVTIGQGEVIRKKNSQRTKTSALEN